MGWYLIFVTCFFNFPIARTTILVGPKSAVYPEGSNVTLQCLAERTNRIVWEHVNDNTVIFIDREKSTRKVKFDNFVISNGEDNFSLTIVNAQLSDEGFYACEEGDESRSANVTIEAGPDLSIHVLVPENRTITEDEQVFVICKAEGAKPAVRLKLKFGENEWIERNNTITNEGLHFTTETRVVRRVTRADRTITCQATGQVSIPPSTTMISINVLHKPMCVIELGTDLAECQCVSNPAVSTYSWYVNGELQSTDPSLRIHEHIPANITCLASNEVGTSPLTSRHVLLTDLQSEASTKYIAIIIPVIFALCVIVIGGLLIIVYKRSKHASKNRMDNEERGSESNAGNDKLLEAKDTTPKTAEENIHLKTSTGGNAIDENHSSVCIIEECIPLNAESEEQFHDAECNFAEDDKGDIHLGASTSRKATDETEPISVDTNDGDSSLEPEQKDEEVKIDPRLQQLLSTISTVISDDWEIFAIEDLELKTETVKEIIRKYSKVSDQLSAALEHWGTSSSVEKGSHLERNILTKSEVYGYYREIQSPCPRGGENNAASSTNKTEKAEFNEQFLQVATFSELLKEVGKYVGRFGTQRLSRQYRELNIDAFRDSQLPTLTGEKFIELLETENLLTDDMRSLRRLKKALDVSFLLRASHVVDTYINEKDPELAKFLSNISAVISQDWEIFAIEKLSLETETVKEIIREHSEVSDQLSAALDHWLTSFSVETRSLLENILTKSEVYNYYKKNPSLYPRGGENNAASSTNKTEKAGSDEKYPQVTTLSELLKEVEKSVGHIGAQRLSRRYRDLNIDTFTDSQITTLTGESFINLLQKENLLSDNMESLRRLKEALDDSLLLRACHLVDTFIIEKEKPEINVSSMESVQQQPEINVSSTESVQQQLT